MSVRWEALWIISLTSRENMKKSISILMASAFLFCGLSCTEPDSPVEEPETPTEKPENPGEKPDQPENPGPDFESQFEKHIVLWEFTGAWCANCPDGYTNMNFILSSNPDFTNYVHPMAFHSNTSDTDDLAIEETDKIMLDMNVTSLGFPSYVVDMHYGGSLVEGVNLREHLYETIEDNPAYCGVAVSSAITDGKASVTVKLMSEVDAVWRTGLYVVEDKVKYYQKDGMKEHDAYTHRHVVREIVSASYRGDRIGNGTAAAGTEVEKTYEIQVDDAWNLENTYVYVIAIDSDGYANNLNYCLMNGSESDYRRK